MNNNLKTNQRFSYVAKNYYLKIYFRLEELLARIVVSNFINIYKMVFTLFLNQGTF